MQQQATGEPMRVEVHYYDPEGNEIDDRQRRIVNGRGAGGNDQPVRP